MAAALTGRIRLTVADPQLAGEQVVFETHIALMGSATDKKLKPFLPLVPPWIKKDSKIGLWFAPTVAAATIDFNAGATTKMILDGTQKLPNGMEKPKQLTLADFEFTTATGIAHADIVLGAIDVFKCLGYYKCPAGMRFAVGRRADGYLYIILMST